MYGSDFDNEARPLVMKLVGIDGSRCPKCGDVLSDKSREQMLSGGRVKCRACDFYGNWRFGTKLEGSRISNTQFLALFFKYALPSDAPSIGKQLGLDPGTVRDWRDRITQAVAAQ